MGDRLAATGVTRKEGEVLALVREHLTNAEIAARLYVSERTVESHVSSLLRKLGATNRRELSRLGDVMPTAGRAGNLPSRSTALIGRGEELDQLIELLTRHRLVTVTGPGGAGKTRVALATASAVAGSFSDGAWLIELGHLHGDADVPSAVATALALQASAGTAAASSTAAALARHHALLVLDNCEHVLDGVVQLVVELEARCERITVLATSREALSLSHEVRFVLGPLDLDADDGTPPAVHLFRERAAAVLGTFDPSDGELRIVDEICRRLDGLPLAIELAAARLPAMSLAELAGHLDESFDVLSRPRGLTARHQSLHATVAWSYDLLTADEQQFFDDVSVFGADFGPAAASAVARATSAPVDDLLASLVDKSLLTAATTADGTRFRQLETLRRYGEARLDAEGATRATVQRYVDHYVAASECADAAVKGANEFHGHRWFTTEWANLRNALRWACDVDDGDAACRLAGATAWWAISRMRLEAERWFDVATSVPSAADQHLRSSLSAAAAMFAHVREDGAGERAHLERAQADQARLGPPPEPWLEAAILNRWSRGPAAALDDVVALRRRAVALGDPFWQVQAALQESLVLATLVRGAALSPAEEVRAVRRLREVLEEAETFAQPSAIAGAAVSLGTALRSAAPDEALGLLERGLELCEPLGVEVVSCTARHELVAHLTQLGRPHEALRLARDGIAHFVRTGAWHEVWPALGHSVGALTDLGRPDVAAIVLGRLDVDCTEVTRNCFDFPSQRERLGQRLGAGELRALLTDGGAMSLPAVGQRVVDAIDDITG